MSPKLRSGDGGQMARFIILLILFAACFLWGGGSRLDIPGLIILQPAAVLCLAALLAIPGPIDWEAVAAPLMLLGALTVVMAVQLIPLPPDLWAQLPGHAGFVEGLNQAGIAEVWRPITLTPDLTLASLISLIVPAAVIVGLAAIPAQRAYGLLPYLIAAAAFSGVLGLAQVAGGPDSAFYRYEITNYGVAVGSFSNRNHQAVLLAMAFPMLALWATMSGRDTRQGWIRTWIAGVVGLFLGLMLLLTGSRAGLGLGLLGLAFSWLFLRGSPQQRPGSIRATLLKLAPILVGVVAIMFVIQFRATGIDRLLSMSFAEDPRAQFWPILRQIATDFAPIGSGFGSFDPVFRSYEPPELLGRTYLNHAHNDLLELFITAGVPGILILGLAMFWWVSRSLAAFRSGAHSRSRNLARLGSAMLLIMFLSSLVDYPLRTPLLAAFAALAAVWLERIKQRVDPQPRQDAAGNALYP